MPSELWDDFNGDGYRDLAVGTPKASGGTVTVTLDSSPNADPARPVNVTQDTAGVLGGSHGFQVFAPRHRDPRLRPPRSAAARLSRKHGAQVSPALRFDPIRKVRPPLLPRRDSATRARQARTDAAVKVSA
ncbi:FG-GAP repeat protein [Streptomyces sp. NPDC003697]